VPSEFPLRPTAAADLLALSLEHRIEAERAATPAEQLELHRVADIYLVLATIDIPAADFARSVS
jgi:hypothetical protein